MSEFENLKVDDKVIYSYGWSSRSVQKVTHVTPTQFIVNGERFNKRTGSRCGEHSFRSSHISLWTPEEDAKIQDERKRRAYLQRVEEVKWREFTTVELENIVSSLALMGK